MSEPYLAVRGRDYLLARGVLPELIPISRLFGRALRGLRFAGTRSELAQLQQLERNQR